MITDSKKMVMEKIRGWRNSDLQESRGFEESPGWFGGSQSNLKKKRNLKKKITDKAHIRGENW